MTARDTRARALAEVRAQLAAATAAKKCHACGCFRRTVETLSSTTAGRGVLAPVLEAARAVLTPTKVDCLGCEACYPAIAANAFDEAFAGETRTEASCPSDAPRRRAGWPPLPGDYQVLRFAAPVAVCTLKSVRLAEQIVHAAPEGVGIVGTLHTENLGIERVIRNVLANPHLRFLVLCGEDTRRAIGHRPGQSLASLFERGVDESQRIVGALGKRPVLKNVSRAEVEAFRRQVELIALIGNDGLEAVLERIRGCLARDPGPFAETPHGHHDFTVEAREPGRLVPDPSGFLVVYPEARRRLLVVEHYTTDGVLDCIVEGATPAAVAAEVIARGLVSRLDHAAYLGRELARAEHSVLTGEPYIQDRAAGAVDEEHGLEAASCGCRGRCSTEAP